MADTVIQQENEQPTPAKQPVQQTVTEHQFTGHPNAIAQPTPGVTGDEPQAQPDTVETFSQGDIDRIVKERLVQERKKYADYADLKAKVTAAEDATKTETERMQAKMTELETANQTLAQERQELAVRSVIVEAAAAAGLPADAALKLVDRTQLKTDEAGQIINATELVQAVATAYPGLLRQTMPRVTAANPARSTEPAGRSDADRFRDYFQGGDQGFWRGGGVQTSDVAQ